MSKKRRPHKPAPSHRPVTHAPNAANAAVAGAAVAPSIPVATGDATDVSSRITVAADAPALVHDDASPGVSSGSAVPVEPAAAAFEMPAVSRPAASSTAPVQAEFAPPTEADIRGVLIQVAGARLLLPNATIAEVLSYADPEPVGAEAPDWLLGRMRWRGWQLPLIAFGRLAGVAEEKAALGSKVVVLKALAGTGRTPYFAILTQGFPRLVTVARGGLVLDDDSADAMPRGVQARVRLNENEALLPDLEAVEALVAEALEQAA